MASPALAPLQGMTDLAAPEVFLWQQIEQTARLVLGRYGFAEVRTPILERLDVFTRAIGEETDVVRKEMYAFEDRGGRRIALRPEGTAGVIRHAAGGADRAENRLYYIGPMFRAERPQAGRKRQFHQLGVEALGGPSPAADAECLALQAHLLDALGLEGFTVRLNTRGGPDDAAAVADGLRAALQPHAAGLCADCDRRLQTNVLRVLDCKQEACRALVQALPPVASFMGEPARAYLREVRHLLERLEIATIEDPLLVRGLDYYRHTIWEITHPALGAQDALSGGGRYAMDMAGRTVEGVGFAMGIERLVMALDARGVQAADPDAERRVWLVAAGEAAREDNLVLAQALRRRGVPCGLDLAGRSVKAQMRAAHRAGVRFAVVRGDDEQARGVYRLKDMRDGIERELALPALFEALLEPGASGAASR